MIKAIPPFYKEPTEPLEKKATLTKADLLKAIENAPMDAEIWLMIPYNAKPLENVSCGNTGIDLY